MFTEGLGFIPAQAAFFFFLRPQKAAFKSLFMSSFNSDSL